MAAYRCDYTPETVSTIPNDGTKLAPAMEYIVWYRILIVLRAAKPCPDANIFV